MEFFTPCISFGTYLGLLFHIIAFDIKALVVPWHQFLYTLVITSGRRQQSADLHHLRSFYQQGAPSFLEKGKSPTVPGPDSTEGVLRQGSSTRGPRATCGPRASFVRPGKGISQNTMRYEY